MYGLVNDENKFSSFKTFCKNITCYESICYHLYFLCISKVWNMLHQWEMGRVQIKECYVMFTYNFVAFFCCFSSKNCIFIVFVSFFDEVSNLHNRILTSQKPEFVIRNCQWNCML